MTHFLAPATPSELLAYLVAHQTYPTTLILCCPRPEFQQALLHNVAAALNPTDRPVDAQTEGPSALPKDASLEHAPQALVSASLHQAAIAKHIRVLFAPTVSHLRACLATFSPLGSGKVPPPPLYTGVALGDPSAKPFIVLYGLLDAHRDTSEWNAQGISCTASLLVDTAHRTNYIPVLVEPKDDDGHPSLEALLAETVPLLDNTTMSEGPWSGRRVDIRRVLERWFDFHGGPLTEDQ